MPKTVRCVSLRNSGRNQVAVPTAYLDPFDDGEERALPDDIADLLLRNPDFEEVQAPKAPVSFAPKDEAN